ETGLSPELADPTSCGVNSRGISDPEFSQFVNMSGRRLRWSGLSVIFALLNSTGLRPPTRVLVAPAAEVVCKSDETRWLPRGSYRKTVRDDATASSNQAALHRHRR